MDTTDDTNQKIDAMRVLLASISDAEIPEATKLSITNDLGNYIDDESLIKQCNSRALKNNSPLSSIEEQSLVKAFDQITQNIDRLPELTKKVFLLLKENSIDKAISMGQTNSMHLFGAYLILCEKIPEKFDDEAVTVTTEEKQDNIQNAPSTDKKKRWLSIAVAAIATTFTFTSSQNQQSAPKLTKEDVNKIVNTYNTKVVPLQNMGGTAANDPSYNPSDPTNYLHSTNTKNIEEAKKIVAKQTEDELDKISKATGIKMTQASIIAYNKRRQENPETATQEMITDMNNLLISFTTVKEH
ncbi:MAG: hypothetical protein ACK5O1_03935 [Holosporales bacterium]|jgi:hypothetical protein